jgi:hypothetical protein
MLKNSIHQQANRKIKLDKNSKCEKCFKNNIRLIRHHHDYNKPTDIIILCDKCHRDWHKNNKAVERIKYNQIKFDGDPNGEKILEIRMDKKLYEQLKAYADREDEGFVSRSARKALQKFISEEQSLKK